MEDEKIIKPSQAAPVDPNALINAVGGGNTAGKGNPNSQMNAKPSDMGSSFQEDVMNKLQELSSRLDIIEEMNKKTNKLESIDKKLDILNERLSRNEIGLAETPSRNAINEF